MSIGTFAISALQEIRKIKGFENAVIAGGFVRDHILGADFKDVDIFVPCSNRMDFRRIFGDRSYIKDKSFVKKWYTTSSTGGTLNTLPFFEDTTLKVEEKKEEKFEIKGFSDFQFGGKAYDRNTVNPHFLDMVNCKYMEKIDVDIMAIDFPNDEKFGESVVENFNYNIDKAFFNGVENVATKEFDHDVRNAYATLCRLDDFRYLPRAIDKYNRLKEKYPHLIFQTSVLEIKGKDKKTVKKFIPNKFVPRNVFGNLGPV